MKLGEFLAQAVATGHDRYRVVATGRGHTLARGELANATPDHLTALCEDDAQPLPRDAQHEYVITVESADGSKESRYPIRIRGGQAPGDDVHRVDPLSTTTSAAVVGHLTRLVVDMQKAQGALIAKVIDRDMAETAELGKLRRAMARRGEHEITKLIVEADAAEKAADRARSDDVYKRLLSFGEPLMARLLPGGEASALARLRGSFSDVQLEQLCAELGPLRFGKLMALDTPEKVGALFADEIPPELGRRVFAVLTPSPADDDRRGAEARARTAREGRGRGGVAGDEQHQRCGGIMSDEQPIARGFGRLIEAAKGLKKLADWIDREEAAPLLQERCTRVQSAGWRCTRSGPHRECILEKVHK